MQLIDVQAFRFLGKWDFWRRLWANFKHDHCWGMAAELAFCFILAFFPFLIFLGGLLALLPIEMVTFRTLVDGLSRVIPSQAEAEVSQVLANAEGWQTASRSAALWMGLSLWAASLGLNGLSGVLTRAYRMKERRSYLRIRALSIVVTVGVCFFVLIAAVLLFFGDDFSRWAISSMPFSQQGLLHQALTLGYTVARWVAIFVFISLGLQIVYFAMPATPLPWRAVSPGSFVMTAGLLGGSLAFRTFVNNFANYNNMYGDLGGMLVLVVWFYYCSVCLLLGGQIDSTIFRMDRPSGDVFGQSSGAGDTL